MRCFGEFKDDRTCDLCNELNTIIHNGCLKLTQERRNHFKTLEQIKENCPYRKKCWDEYEPFDGCTKNFDGSMRYTPDCKATLECSEYGKGE